MMQPQQNSQVPAGLQALFVLQDPKVQQALNVLKQQAAPAAQGPQGEPTPTVSGQVLQSFSPPQPQMPPGMPPGMPPQEPPQGTDMAGMAQNAATGSNIQAQQQAQAQEALMKQLMMQQQAQAQQPVMAASGGIASLNASNMEDFADGGVVGYNGTETSEVNLGGVSGIPYYAPGASEERDRLNRLPTDALMALLDMIKRGGAKFIEGTTFDPEYNKPKKAEAEAATPEEAPVSGPSQYGFESELAKELQRRANQGAAPAPSAAPRPSRPAGVAGLPAGRTVMPGEELYAQARREFLNQMPPDQRSLQERRAQEDEYLRSLGLPTSIRPAEEARLKEMADFDAQNRATIAQQNKDAMQGAWMSGILKPAQNLARMFSGAAEGMLGEEGKQREQAVRDAALQRQQMMAANAVRTKLDEADILRARGDIDGYNKAMEEARKFENALSVGLASLSSGQAKDVVNFEQQKALERIKQAGAERVASMRVEGASAKSIYDTVNDNVEKQMTAWRQQRSNKWANPAEEAAQRGRFVAEQVELAKQMGHRITPEMEALIKRPSAAPGTRDNPIKLD